MGYLICRAMRAYGMSYQEVMSIPMRAFWTISGFVERISSDEAKLKLEVAASSQTSEAAQALYERLDKQAPAPVKYTGYAIAYQGVERDEAGFARLKMLAGG